MCPTSTQTEFCSWKSHSSTNVFNDSTSTVYYRESLGVIRFVNRHMSESVFLYFPIWIIALWDIAIYLLLQFLPAQICSKIPNTRSHHLFFSLHCSEISPQYINRYTFYNSSCSVDPFILMSNGLFNRETFFFIALRISDYMLNVLVASGLIINFITFKDSYKWNTP